MKKLLQYLRKNYPHVAGKKKVSQITLTSLTRPQVNYGQELTSLNQQLIYSLQLML